MTKFKILIILLLTNWTLSFSQSTACDTIYDHPDKLASFAKGNKGLLDFVSKHLMQSLQDCKKETGHLVTKLNVKLTINHLGKVISVDFLQADIPQSCKDSMKLNFLIDMDNWTPAINKGENVCSIFILPISCIKWQ